MHHLGWFGLDLRNSYLLCFESNSEEKMSTTIEGTHQMLNEKWHVIRFLWNPPTWDTSKRAIFSFNIWWVTTLWKRRSSPGYASFGLVWA